MKHVLQIVDTYSWAIGSLSKAVMEYNPHFIWSTLEVHPKDLESGKVDLEKIKKAVANAEIIDCQYWRTLSQLIELIPQLKEKPVILTHHNEKNLLSYDWPKNVIHVAKTRYSETVLKGQYSKVYYIPNSFDHKVFKYNTEFPPKEKMVGYVGRIVPWKGLKDIAKACYELKYPLLLMGKHDKPSYFAEIPKEHQDNIRWDYFNCPDEERANFYKNITCYVGNSGSGREVGTLGFIEALASGVPVITTPAGLAADIGEDDVNMKIVDYDDYDGLKDAIKTVMESSSLQQRYRKEGWDTIRGYNNERMAWQYRKLINDIVYDADLVSVIIPTTEERDVELRQIVDNFSKQTYKNFELIIVVDQSLDEDQYVLNLREMVKQYRFVVKVLSTNRYGGYNLALARNLGLIESDGKYIMLNDSRLCPDSMAIQNLLSAIKEKEPSKVWVFGEKGGGKSTFVENFSMIPKRDLVFGGMFNERISAYGGMSQELRERFTKQGFEFGYVPSAKAVQLCKGSLTPDKRNGIIEMKNLIYKLTN